eukprot:CAMPEP_0194040930 /NCGR_PEP_ID=MMETSP0009_2-20130614/12859_1 /TAXON_ID=210454 /ORGANISM="Grammatophora oceanica, Strain CCMP 410" /LENGTH=244 /DNA_ID=CAMNT_0038684225 /DNA_START=20 /DNA_END=751 /DNA_ORIENTATION=+
MAKLFRRSKNEGASSLVAATKGQRRSVMPNPEMMGTDGDVHQTTKVVVLDESLDCCCTESSSKRKEVSSSNKKKKLRSPAAGQRESDEHRGGVNSVGRRISHHRCKKPLKSSLRSTLTSTKNGSASMSSCSSSSTSTAESSVGFGNVEIHEFALTIGDSPAVSDGPPISLSWTETRHKVVEFERFERVRDGLRRSGPELEIDAGVRRELLLRLKFSREEIYEAEIDSYNVYMQRLATQRSDRRK